MGTPTEMQDSLGQLICKGSAGGLMFIGGKVSGTGSPRHTWKSAVKCFVCAMELVECVGSIAAESETVKVRLVRSS